VLTSSIIDTRRHQMFPTLAPAEIERLRRFGEVRSYGRGEPLVSVGEVGQGLTIPYGQNIGLRSPTHSCRLLMVIA
jgi:hypothetical protein